MGYRLGRKGLWSHFRSDGDRRPANHRIPPFFPSATTSFGDYVIGWYSLRTALEQEAARSKRESPERPLHSNPNGQVEPNVLANDPGRLRTWYKPNGSICDLVGPGK